MKLSIPDFCLVVLIGVSGSGKSTFARRHFKATEIISSDTARGLVSDDDNDLDATADAFELVQFIAEKRLARRRLTVIDATNVRPEDRARFVTLARRHHVLPVAIVIDPGESVCHARNRARPDRQFGPHVVRNQLSALNRGRRKLDKEGFRTVHELRSVADVDAIDTIERHRLWTDRRDEWGPFDIIGDVHGCADELVELLTALGYQVALSGVGEARRADVVAPAGRRAIFVGDLVDRGPNSPDALRIVMDMVAAGQAIAVPGNHDVKLVRWLDGRNVKISHGIDRTIAQLAAEPASFKARVREFLDRLVSHAWLEGGRLAIAHAGIKQSMIGRASGAVREFCLYGETSGETDEFGLPVRYNWAAEYRGAATIVYGHTPVPEAEWLNNTLCIDTGCCFGGKLTALRWPEKNIVSVPARAVHAQPIRPFGHPPTRPGADVVVRDSVALQAAHDDLLDIDDVTGKRIITTGLVRTIQVPEANAAAALEVMTRFAISPKWLIHLPPTMSPPATSQRPELLEHPDEAFAYYREAGVAEVVVEEKHMGSRALLVVTQGEDVARRRFGVTTGETGAIFTRTGRSFFPDVPTTEAMLERVRGALTTAGFWSRHRTDWVLLDAEILPWSAKAQSLIKDQYAATGAAARAGLDAAIGLLEGAARSGLEVGALLEHYRSRGAKAVGYVDAYRRYCWPVHRLADYRIAPFHILASEGSTHFDKDHGWHLRELAPLTEGSEPTLMSTPHRVVDLADAASVADATAWWTQRTSEGAEGMVFKPMGFTVRGARGLVQPAIKSRGREYLRIIYGPEYDLPDNLARLRNRGLGMKRSLAMREFALGREALERFVAREPLRRVHECVFAILALESEPVDPRL